MVTILVAKVITLVTMVTTLVTTLVVSRTLDPLAVVVTVVSSIHLFLYHSVVSYFSKARQNIINWFMAERTKNETLIHWSK